MLIRREICLFLGWNVISCPASNMRSFFFRHFDIIGVDNFYVVLSIDPRCLWRPTELLYLLHTYERVSTLHFCHQILYQVCFIILALFFFVRVHVTLSVHLVLLLKEFKRLSAWPTGDSLRIVWFIALFRVCPTYDTLHLISVKVKLIRRF